MPSTHEQRSQIARLLAQINQGPGQTVARSSPSLAPGTSTPSLLEADFVRAKTAFSPGFLLCRGRDMLTEKRMFQQWAHGAYETHWCARDLLQRDANVIVCEMDLPEMKALTRQASLRAAMRALLFASRHSHMPALLDVFRDNGRDFFLTALLIKSSEGTKLFLGDRE